MSADTILVHTHAGKLGQRLRIADGGICADATDISGSHSWLTNSACSLTYLCHSVHRSHADNAFRTNELRITQCHWQPYPLLPVHIVYTLLVCIVPYSCMLTQLYHDLLRVKLVNPNENLLRTLDTWQIFGTRQSYTCLQQCYFSRCLCTFFDANL